MTEHPKKGMTEQGQAGMKPFHPSVADQLRDYYQSVQEEGIPDRFMQLLEKLDAAERGAALAEKDDAL